MSVCIRDGIGRNVSCRRCNHALILSSKTDYKKCNNCGGVYINPTFKPVITTAYNWHYLRQIIFGV